MDGMLESAVFLRRWGEGLETQSLSLASGMWLFLLVQKTTSIFTDSFELCVLFQKMLAFFPAMFHFVDLTGIFD